MNYIKEMNAFMDWLDINPLESTTQALWFHIMAIANKSGWPEWFTIANLTLMAKVRVSENTLNKHRNILIQKKRIIYKNQGRQKAGKYKIIPFTEGFTLNNEVKKDVTSNIEVKPEVKHEVSREVKREVNPSALYKLNKTKLNDINNNNNNNQEIDEEFSEIAKIYQEAGIDFDGFTSSWISDSLEAYGFQWVKNAILEAANQGVRNRAYVTRILNNWKNWGGMTLSTDKKNNESKFTQAKKTKFHNFEGRSEQYSADEINKKVEDIAERKRREYREKMKQERLI